MPSPFPGMNPYLEQDDVWHDFHEKFLPAVAERLVPQVRRNYIVKLDEHIYVYEFPHDPLRLIGRSDVGLSLYGLDEVPPSTIGTLGVPALVHLPVPDVERVSFLEIRDRKSREPVTVIELLSPSNKRTGSDREQYLAKRASTLGSQAHLVEIDLSRGGRPMPLNDRPECAYSILVSRVEDRPSAGLWPLSLGDRLPVIPIPLRQPAGDARLDLQDVVHRIYDASGYEDYIYEASPSPPLTSEELAWAEAILIQKQ